MFTFSLLLLTAGLVFVDSYPNHAECRVIFKIPLSCGEVRTRLVQQINTWNRNSRCPGDCHLVSEGRGAPLVPVKYEGTNTECRECPCGQKCLYQLQSVASNQIKGSHFTPVKKYEDKFRFSLTEQGASTCRVNGFSSATLSYAYFDFGTNYCNLRNLMDGAGLSSISGYGERTSKDRCMQLDKINCRKY
eukprot:TRINITY_DN11665_c0_g1_i7.p1 TRINITY_DN11665_c0_g1~~TRINITY_DN11665_c0_g1_i7.p1  ORF type:complete len:190 (-),score=11.73 TRINITY_DN11665_c0_g1_i7:75-644(-)